MDEARLYQRLIYMEHRVRCIERDIETVGLSVLAEHLRVLRNGSDDGGWSILSDREQQLTLMIVDGTTNAEIAHALELSRQTVKNHMTNIFRKLNITNRTELTALAFRNKWVE